MLKSSKHSSKGISYQFLHEWLGTGLLTAAGLKWKSRSVTCVACPAELARPSSGRAHIARTAILSQAPDDYAVVPL